VLDSSGGTIANATVTATGADTGAVYKTTTTSTGAYRLPDLQVGTYNVGVASEVTAVREAAWVPVVGACLGSRNKGGGVQCARFVP